MTCKTVSRIDALTDRQIAQLERIRDEWIEIGLSCEPLDLPKATSAVAMSYQSAKLDAPRRIVVCDGPVSGAIVAIIIKQQLVGESVRESVRESVWASVRESVWESVGESVRASVRESVWESVGESVRESVRESVWESVRESVGDQTWGSHDAAWLAFYDTFWRFGLREKASSLRGLTQLAQSCGWWSPYRNAAILQHRHSVLHRNAAGRLHRDGGMAVAYRDGWGFWALNGVRVPQWLAETPSEQIDVSLLLKEQNAEIRRELVRKVGAERIAYKLGAKSRDKSGDYELLDIPVGNRQPARALKMLNPSVPECWHIEFVDRQCKSVQEALNFRNGLKPEQIDDVNGDDFYQQGDVLIFPKGATKFKSRPVILT